MEGEDVVPSPPEIVIYPPPQSEEDQQQERLPQVETTRVELSPRVLIQLEVSVQSKKLVESVAFEVNLDDLVSAQKIIRYQWSSLRGTLEGGKMLKGSVTLRDGANQSLKEWKTYDKIILQEALEKVSSEDYADPKIDISLCFEQLSQPSTVEMVKDYLMNTSSKTGFQSRKFIDVEGFRKTFGPEIIKEILKPEKVDDTTCEEVHKNGLKILATLMIANISNLPSVFMDCWNCPTLQGEGTYLRDDNLPFEEFDLPNDMSQGDCQRFCEYQRQTCPFEFNTSTALPKNFEPHDILPIISNKIILEAEGNFAVVSKIGIFTPYQKLYRSMRNHKNDQGPDPNPELALKDFKNPRSQQMNFDREAKMLVELNKLNDKHIIKLLFAFTKDDTSGLIFPLAECSLDAYFKKNDPRQYVGTEKAQHTAWIFEQFEGIFKGLARVHGDPRARKETLSPGQEDLVVGYHHDIKPSNILLFYSHEVEKHPFEEPEVQFGRLQLSDFGLGKFRTVRIDGTGTRTIQGTITYRAPECDPEAKGMNQNRKYDIWGVGCVLLEFLVWLTEGPEGLNEFAGERYHSNNTNDPTFTDKTFYLKHGDGSVTLRKAVTDVLGRLKTNAKGTKLRELINQTVDLIEKCLEIEPEKRPGAKLVFEEFRKIASQAREKAG